ncbi:MAG: hypothetical protein ACE5HV_07140 [Acidobacteriota bacterium]
MSAREDTAKLCQPAPQYPWISRLSRRELLRWAGVAGIGSVGAGLVGCSDAPEQEAATGSTTPTSLMAGATVNGSVLGLLTGVQVNKATVEIVGVGTVTTDFSGSFSVHFDNVGDFVVKISAKGFLTRQTRLRLVGNVTIVVTLIETDQNLTLKFLDQFARGQGPVADLVPRTPGATNRWLQRPNVLIYRRLDGDRKTVVSDVRVSKISDAVNSIFSGLTGSVFGFAPSIQVVDTPPPSERKQIPAGAIGIFQTADGSRGAGHTGSLSDPNSIAIAHAFTDVGASIGVLTHVFAHALGATEVATSMPSVMNPDGRSTLTAEDMQAAIALYNRPPGSRAPDTDPDGFFING